uniref:Intraflagellar transport protein 140 homolog n=1 Tax=Timema douglasi TaxID=61478 RepID=A0A7R8VPB9_TIMDO|nr:unnamed protein product [Timema douglasi]
MSLYFDYKLQNLDSSSINTLIEWHTQHLLLAVASFSREKGGFVTLFDELGEVVQGVNFPRHPVAQATALSWHPVKKLLVTGWENGQIEAWGGEKDFVSVQSPHRDAITILQWSEQGGRLVSADGAGSLVGSKVDARGQILTLFHHELKDPLVHITFRKNQPGIDISGLAKAAVAGDERALDLFSAWRPRTAGQRIMMQAGSDNLCFYVSSITGVLFYFNEEGTCTEVLNTDGSMLKKLLFHERKDCLIVMTEGLNIGQFNVDSKGNLSEVMKVKLSGRSQETSMVWAGPGLVAVTTGDMLVRCLDLDTGENYLLETTSPSGAAAAPAEAFTSLAYCSQKRVLCGGTNLGNIVMWKYSPPLPELDLGPGSSTSIGDPSKGWVQQTPCSVPGAIKFLSWAHSEPLLAVNTIIRVYVLKEQTLSAHYSHGVSAVQVSPSNLLVEVLSEDSCPSLGLKTDLQVSGVSVCTDHVVVWSSKTLVVYQLTIDTSGEEAKLTANVAGRKNTNKNFPGYCQADTSFHRPRGTANIYAALRTLSCSGHILRHHKNLGFGQKVGSFNVVVWSSKTLVVYQLTIDTSGEEAKLTANVAGSFACEAEAVYVYEQSVVVLQEERIQIRTFQGTVKQTLPFTDLEGQPIFMQLCGHFLVVATSCGIIKIWDLARREAKLHFRPKNLEEAVSDFGEVISASCNNNGTKVSISIAKSNFLPDTKLFLWDIESDSLQYFNFLTGRVDDGENEEYQNSLSPELTMTSTSMPGDSRPLYLSSALAQAVPTTLSTVWTAPQSMFSKPSVTSFPLYSAPMRTPLFIGSLGGHYHSRFLASMRSSFFYHWTRPGSNEGYLARWFLELLLVPPRLMLPEQSRRPFSYPYPHVSEHNVSIIMTSTSYPQSRSEGLTFDCLGRFVLSHQWDAEEPKLVVCEAKLLPKKTSNVDTPHYSRRMSSSTVTMPANTIIKKTQGQEGEVVLVTFFTCPEVGLIVQDVQSLPENHHKLLGVCTPHYLLLSKPSSQLPKVGLVKRMAMRDFEGLESCDKATREAVLNFSYNMTTGNMDEAFRAIKTIRSEVVWESLAKMCVKTKRLDVASVCLGHMKHARGAMALRQAAHEPELEARVAMLAVHLGLMDEAERLYELCGRYDQLNALYQAAGEWDKAMRVAEEHDRIHLRATCHNYASYLEGKGDTAGAARMYERADTHRSQLTKWWGQYMESTGRMDEAIECYEKAGDYFSLVRILCFQEDLTRAAQVASTTGDKAACYHLARRYESQGRIQEAVHFFTIAQAYGNAVRICKEHGLEEGLWNLALLAGPREQLEAAQYFEQSDHPLPEKSVLLYHRAGMLHKALDLAFRTQQYSALQLIALDLNSTSDPVLIAKCAKFFVDNKQFDKAVDLLAVGKQYEEALALCVEHDIPVTEDLAEKLTMVKGEGDEGLRVKAMKALLKSGDTEKIVFFANVSRQKEIYVMAANYLQSLDWKNNPDVLRNIVTFYSKGKAPELLANFYVACAQVEVDEYQNYEKALGALGEANRCLAKVTNPRDPMKHQKAEETLNSRMALVKKFIDIRRLYDRGDHESSLTQSRQLLQSSDADLESAVRRGDVYALMVEHHVSAGELKAAQHLVEEFRKLSPGANVTYYIPPSTIDKIARGLGLPVSSLVPPLRDTGLDVRLKLSGAGDAEEVAEEEEEIVEDTRERIKNGRAYAV